jgi:hypothetical protein
VANAQDVSGFDSVSQSELRAKSEMMNYRLFVGTFICLFTIRLVAESGDVKPERSDPQSMETLFVELQQLAKDRVRVPPADDATVLAHHKREREIEHEYLNRDAEATTFLLSKLSAINKREETFIHGPDDFEGGVQFMMSEIEAGRTLLVRYAICYILADMYSKASASQRKEIIQGIVDSFLPSTQGREDIETMDGALFRLGKDGVKGFLKLAGSQSQTNRCQVSEVLNELGASGAPKINCKTGVANRTESINAFRDWWTVNASKVQWPDFPGYFDSPARHRHVRQVAPGLGPTSAK